MVPKYVKLIPEGHPNRPGITINPIAVVIHYTANYNPGATDTMHVGYVGRAYKRVGDNDYEANGSPFRYGSAQVFIDEDSHTIVIPRNEVSWACGDRPLNYNNGSRGQTTIARDVFRYNQNYLTINYELCINKNWNQVVKNAIEIVAKDIIDYNISENRIYRHYDITGKICPKPFVDDVSAWNEFKSNIIKKVKEMKKMSTPTPDPKPITNLPKSKYFTDIPEGHWSIDVFDKAKDYGIIKGTGKPGIVGFSEEFARIVALQIRTIDLVEKKVGSLK